MSDADPAPIKEQKRKPLPRWLVIVVIGLSGLVTAAAMSVTGLRGPELAWERANRGVAEAWYGRPNPGSEVALPARPADAVLPVAAAPGVPTIVAGAPMTHADRGACTLCHAVVTAQGTPLAAITSLSTLPHEFRGVCGNCHVSRIASSLGGNPVAGTPVAPPRTTPAGPSEAEWQGLEVANGTLGVVVRSAEGSARRLGLQAGDLVTSINGVPVRTLTDFIRVTDNGALAQAAVIVRRNEQRLAFEFAGSAASAQPLVRTQAGAPPVAIPPANAQF